MTIVSSSTAPGITTEKIYKVTTYNINYSTYVHIRIMLQTLSVRTPKMLKFI